MRLLVLEPLQDRGMRIVLWNDQARAAVQELGHSEDVIACVQKMLKKGQKIEHVVVRSVIGSFSASRNALVVGTVLSETRGCYLHITEQPLDSWKIIAQVLEKKSQTFAYAAEPHITIKK